MSNDVDAGSGQEASMGTEEVEAEKGVVDEPGAGDQAGAGNAGGDLGEDHEVRAPKGVKAPYVPSAKEIEAHERTHCPPRRWCDHCVRGQSKDMPHSTIRASSPTREEHAHAIGECSSQNPITVR